MSVAAILWALNEAPDIKGIEQVVLIKLAQHADEHGRAAWPSQSNIAYAAHCTDRQVRNCLKSLEAAGLIQRGNQSAVAHLPKDERPVVYNLQLAVKRTDAPPRKQGGRPQKNADQLDNPSENPRKNTTHNQPEETETPGNLRRNPRKSTTKPPELEFLQKVLEKSLKGGELREQPTAPVQPSPTAPLEESFNDKQQTATAAAAPAPRCPQDHEPGTPCGRCADDRRARQEWDRQQAEHAAAKKADARRALDACKLCDEYGWLLADRDHDGPPRKCTHKPLSVPQKPENTSPAQSPTQGEKSRPAATTTAATSRQDTLRRIITEHTSGKSHSDIAQELNRDGLRTATGRHWRYQDVKRSLEGKAGQHLAAELAAAKQHVREMVPA